MNNYRHKMLVTVIVTTPMYPVKIVTQLYDLGDCDRPVRPERLWLTCMTWEIISHLYDLGDCDWPVWPKWAGPSEAHVWCWSVRWVAVTSPGCCCLLPVPCRWSQSCGPRHGPAAPHTAPGQSDEAPVSMSAQLVRLHVSTNCHMTAQFVMLHVSTNCHTSAQFVTLYVSTNC